MSRLIYRAALMILAASLCTLTGARAAAGTGPLKVFILAGQSNMQGHANISTLGSMADDPKTAPILREMLNADGAPRVCDEVWVSSLGCGGNQYSDLIEQTGKLTAGFGASNSEIGPEYTFGIYIAKLLGEPVLLIKTSWGGRSLHTDFRPPGSGPEVINDFMLAEWKKRGLNADEETARIRNNDGVFYHHMIEHVRKVLANVKRMAPEYDPKRGYKLAGFVWFQGWNDMVDSQAYPNRMRPGGYDDYSRLMAQFIRDVRKDLAAPKLPFVIGVMGVGGMTEGAKPPQVYFRQAQAAPASLQEFRGNVSAVETAPYWDDDLDALQQRMESLNSKINREARPGANLTPEAKEVARKNAINESFTPDELKRLKGVSNAGYHYLGAARILAPIGKAFAEAMADLQKTRRRK